MVVKLSKEINLNGSIFGKIIAFLGYIGFIIFNFLDYFIVLKALKNPERFNYLKFGSDALFVLEYLSNDWAISDFEFDKEVLLDWPIWESHINYKVGDVMVLIG